MSVNVQEIIDNLSFVDKLALKLHLSMPIVGIPAAELQFGDKVTLLLDDNGWIKKEHLEEVFEALQ